MRKALRKQLPAFFDLVQWLVDHGHASTRKEAKTLILDGKVKSDSHPLGVHKVASLTPEGKLDYINVVMPHVPVEFRRNILVG